MMLQVFSVYDKAVGAFMAPFYARSKGEALRSFTTAANDAAHEFNKHAMDYSLMFLGEFDDGSGSYRCVDPQRIISAFECLADDPFKPETKVEDLKSRRLPM